MVVPDIDLSKLADEEFLIYRAKELQNTNSSASKSWLITAQVLYPNNFRVQFEVYLIEKAARNIEEAAKCMANLMQEFAEEACLLKEIDAIMRAVQASSNLVERSGESGPPDGGGEGDVGEGGDGHSSFLMQLFYALPKGIQRGLVLSAAKRCSDTMSHCSLLLLLTAHFPETVQMQAPNLVETLLSAEKLSSGPLNPYRRKLVCSVIPVVVGGVGEEGGSGLSVSPQLLHHLLFLALEYYTALLYTTATKGLDSSAGDVDSPHSSQHRYHHGTSGTHQHHHAASSSSTSSPTGSGDGWRRLFWCVRAVSARLGWSSLARHLAPDGGGNSSREATMQRLQVLVRGWGQEGVAASVDADLLMEVLYVATALFLHAMHEYTTKMRRDNTGGCSVALTLVEAFTAPPSGSPSRSNSVCSDDADVLSPPRPKRQRTSQDADALVPYISVGQGEGLCVSGLAASLSAAIKCWDLLHSHPALRTEFSKLLERLHPGPALRVFTTDMLLHDARLTEAGRELRLMLAQWQDRATTGAVGEQAQTWLPFSHLEVCLKLASVNYALSNLSGAAEAALEAIQLLPPPSSTAPPPPTAPTSPLLASSSATPSSSLTITSGVERHLHLLPLSRAHALQFVVTLLIAALRTRVLLHKFHDDLSLGHLLTLVQFEWPRHESVFAEVVSVLVKQGGLVYEQFPLYVTTPEIIEELVYLHTRDGGGLHLEIVPPSPHLTKQQRTVSTRGADRGSKHDFKQAMRRQMLRCEESVPQNIIAFLHAEGRSLHQNLM